MSVAYSEKWKVSYIFTRFKGDYNASFYLNGGCNTSFIQHLFHSNLERYIYYREWCKAIATQLSYKIVLKQLCTSSVGKQNQENSLSTNGQSYVQSDENINEAYQGSIVSGVWLKTKSQKSVQSLHLLLSDTNANINVQHSSERIRKPGKTRIHLRWCVLCDLTGNRGGKLQRVGNKIRHQCPLCTVCLCRSYRSGKYVSMMQKSFWERWLS